MRSSKPEVLFCEDLRDLASALDEDGVEQIVEAAEMLKFFFGQMQTVSVKMDGQSSHRFRGGWPMTHCKGPNRLAAVRAAIKAMQGEKCFKIESNHSAG